MKKKAAAKTKSSKRAAKNPEVVTPDLLAVMTKIAERLEALERKTDQILSRGQHQERRPQPQAPQQNPSHSQAPSEHRHPKQHSGNGGRQLYQAVCAECNKSCEIPFKPTGDRPVYCQDCFADRKANRKGNSDKPQPSLAGQAQRPPFGQGRTNRQIRVEKHNVGRITVSEMVSASAQHSQKRRPSKHARR